MGVGGGGGGASGAYNSWKSSFDTADVQAALINEDSRLAYDLEVKRAERQDAVEAVAPAAADLALVNTPENGEQDA